MDWPHQASLSLTISWSLPKFMFIVPVMHPAISSSVITFSSCLESFPALVSFPMSWLFVSGGQSIGASASVLPMNIQDWFTLGLNGWSPAVQGFILAVQGVYTWLLAISHQRIYVRKWLKLFAKIQFQGYLTQSYLWQLIIWCSLNIQS